ncbi:hypothetical protein J7K25_00815 [bacterium]|nr:hypothetical protein [bacterium]
MIKKNVSLEEVVAFLNELTKIDRKAMQKLCKTRVKCNKKLAKHPTVQVVKNKNGETKVGFLGILNGLFGIDEKGWGTIAANFVPNGRGKLEGFVILKKNTEGKVYEKWPTYPK